MPKDIPKIFVNKIDKKFNNNNKIFYSKKWEEKNNLIEEEYSPKEVKDKIIDIFNSPNFVYKMDVIITTKDNQIQEKKLIAMINDTILTLDEEKIPISDIKDIKEKTT